MYNSLANMPGHNAGNLPFMAGGILLVALLFYGLRLWSRFQGKKGDSFGLVENPGRYRIFAILGIIFFFFVIGLVIGDVVEGWLNQEH